jgi:hypothetical protein
VSSSVTTGFTGVVVFERYKLNVEAKIRNEGGEDGIVASLQLLTPFL